MLNIGVLGSEQVGTELVQRQVKLITRSIKHLQLAVGINTI